jgi:hypothetical protein
MFAPSSLGVELICLGGGQARGYGPKRPPVKFDESADAV